MISLGPALPITGLQPGETLSTISYPRGTGQLYGFGSTNQFYQINPDSGAARAIGAPVAGLEGDSVEIVSAESSVLNIVTNVGQFYQLDLDTGVTTRQPDLAYSPSDSGAGQTPDLRAGEGGFYIDERRGQSVGLNYNTGTAVLVTFGSPGFAFTGELGFDGVFLTGHVAGSPELGLFARDGLFGYRKLAAFADGTEIRDITVEQPVEYTARALTSDNRLITFHTHDPETVLSSVPITGTTAGETISALSYRAATGTLYGFGSAGRLYAIAESTGVATAVSPDPITPAYDGTKPSLTQLNGADLFLLTTKWGQQLSIDPTTGTVGVAGPDLAYPDDDFGGPGEASVVAEAFVPLQISGIQGPLNYSSLFSIDSERDTINFRGFFPDSGMSVIHVDQPLDRDVTDDVSIDSTTGSTVAAYNYLILTDAGATTSTLFTYSPQPYTTAGASPLGLTRIGSVGGGATIVDFALAPVGVLMFSSPTYSASVPTPRRRSP